MVNYEAAIKRPFTDLKKLVIGIVLQLIPIVNFISLGYQLNCARMAMKKKYELPEWRDWEKLFVDGLKAVIIGIVYMLPAVIILGVVASTILYTMMASVGVSGQFDPSMVLAGLMGSMGVGILIALLWVCLVFYLLPSAVMSFLSKESFGAAFSFGEVFRKAFRVKYFVVWVLAMLYSAVLGMLLMIIPFIGTAIAGFVTGVTAMTLFGEIYPEL